LGGNTGKYKLGPYTYSTEEEYKLAVHELKIIKAICNRYNVEDPKQARKIVDYFEQQSKTFSSNLGKTFYKKILLKASEDKKQIHKVNPWKITSICLIAVIVLIGGFYWIEPHINNNDRADHEKVSSNTDAGWLFDKNEPFEMVVLDDVVYFGAYPADEIKDDEISPEILNAEYSEGDWSVATIGEEKILRMDCGEFYSFDEFDVGTLSTKYRYFAYRTIPWRILERKVEGSKMELLLLSEYILDHVSYQGDEQAVIWETSSIREWLNSDFLDYIFSEEEQQVLVPTSIVSKCDVILEDKVFLLSKEEVTNHRYGFELTDSFSESREAVGTEYSWRKWELYKGEDYYKYNFHPKESWIWWLRGTASNDWRAQLVKNGAVFSHFVNKIAGVRPAIRICIDLDSKEYIVHQEYIWD